MTGHEPRKRPTQARARATVEVILEAAAHILEVDGIATLNTNSIAERAGVSIGSLYQYFPSKEAIFTELIRRNKMKLLAGLSASMNGAELGNFAAQIEKAIEVTIQFQFDRPELARTLKFLETILPIDAETEQKNQQIAETISGALRHSGIPIPDALQPETIAQDVIAIVRGMVDAAAIARETEVGALKARVLFAVIGYFKFQNSIS